MIFIEENSTYMMLGLFFAVVILFILCIVLFVKMNGEKKRYDHFMGASRRPSHNLEMKIDKYFATSINIEQKYTKLLDMVTDMDKTMKSNVQKVGLIRYNPFDEMGGNLCFALALLDGENNGVVLNGIHSRTGSFTYAKPIQMGVSIYMLSEEELKAVEMAKEQAYHPVNEKVVKVKFKKIFKRKDKTAVFKDQMELAAVEAEKNIGKEKQNIVSLGDVTLAEKELISEDEALADKIAVASEFNEESFMEELQIELQESPIFIRKIEDPEEEEIQEEEETQEKEEMQKKEV